MSVALLEITIYPNPILRSKSKKLEAVGDEETKLINYMVDTMYTNKGIGLAAPQIGILKRIIVVDAGEGLLKMVNPQIISKVGQSLLEEGCLSFPGKLVEIQRAEEVAVSFTDDKNKNCIASFKGLTARAIQHEIDHLNGRLIIDYLPWYKKVFLKRGETKCLQ